MSRLLIYGANGYTGELTARHAAEQGMTPILAGRNDAAVTALAGELGLESRIFDLSDERLIANAIEDVDVVLHCAGPFTRTAIPMVNACLAASCHYLDITGEVDVFESLSQRDEEALSQGIMLLPGAGFDVVPTDCLGAHLHRRLPDATHLTLAFQALSRVSRGTAMTAIEHMGKGNVGLVRRDGQLVTVPTAWKSREIDFGRGPRSAMTIPWGDVSTAFHSTGIPNIEVYMALPTRLIRAARISRHFGFVIGISPIQSFLKQRVRAGQPGPTPSERQAGASYLWGEAVNAAGASVTSRMQAPEGYTLTVLASLCIAKYVLAGRFTPGYQTPSSAYGADLVLEIPGVSRIDLD